MKVTALLPAVLIAAALAAPAQDTSDVLWAKDSFSPLRAFLDSADEWHFYQAAVHWHWNDSLLIASDLVRGIHRVFEIDAYRGIGLRELEGFRGKGIFAFSRDSGMVFTYQPPFAKARYPSGELLDSFPAWPPPGYRDAVLNTATNQLLVWVDGPPTLWLYSLDTYQPVDTIPLPRQYPYGQPEWPDGRSYTYGAMSWSTDGRYLLLGLIEQWYVYTGRTWELRQQPRTWLLDIPNRRVLRLITEWYGWPDDLKSSWSGPPYIAAADNFYVFDAQFRLLRTIPVSGSWLRSLDISPDGRYVAGGPGSSGNTRIWEIESGQLLHWYQRGGASNVRYSPSGAYIKTHSEGSIAVLRNVVLSSVEEPTQPFPVLRPTPTTGTLLMGPLQPGIPTQIVLFDLRGRLVARLYDGIPAIATLELSVASLPAGTYLLRLHTDSSVHLFLLLKEQ